MNVQDERLPALRDDLQLLAGPVAVDGAPTWTIYDPLRSRFFRIGWSAFQMLSRWSAGSVRRLLTLVREQTTCQVELAEVLELIRFLQANSLTVEPAGGRSDAYLAQYRANRQHWLLWLIQNYLFLRVPLVRPERFLRATLPYVEVLFSQKVFHIVIAAGVIGLYLVSRQWETFKDTFLHFFSLQGMFFYFLALAGTKVLHELGHAYTATRYGCRVPTMGVAFLVMFPVLYTDVTDVWRLNSRRQRMHVAAAGMIVELSVACICTLAWSFLPDSPLRSATFVLATVSWVVSLTINLSPFMRFDGYYLLADWMGVDNLQERAFRLARWHLRRVLFATQEPKSEQLPRRLDYNMTVYAWATWVYRLIVFTGIALLVYHFFFKALGLFLFAVELWWFVLLPITREMGVWWKMRSHALRTPRTMVLAAGLLACLAALLIPWHGSVRVPAVMEAFRQAVVYAPEAGKILGISFKAGQSVGAGDVLLTLQLPQLDADIDRTDRRVQMQELRLQRAATNPEDVGDLQVAMQELSKERSRLAGLRARRDRLVIRAPFDGVVRDIADSLHVGRWIDTRLAIAVLVAPGTEELKGLISEADVGRIAVGAQALFRPEDITLKSLAAEVVEIGDVNVGRLETPYLASTHGGAIAVREKTDGSIAPEATFYPVRLAVAPGARPARAVRGTVLIDATARSVLRRAYDIVASVMIRESGF